MHIQVLAEAFVYVYLIAKERINPKLLQVLKLDQATGYCGPAISLNCNLCCEDFRRLTNQIGHAIELS
jgi:hypothetical protein